MSHYAQCAIVGAAVLVIIGTAVMFGILKVCANADRYIEKTSTKKETDGN